jgi:hypothetical protein
MLDLLNIFMFKQVKNKHPIIGSDTFFKVNSRLFNKVLLMVVRVLSHFQQYFSYIMAVSFIAGGNQITQRKPLTCHKSLTNFIKYTLP